MSNIKTLNNEKSKYFKAPRERVIFYRCSLLYIFALYIMPPYFGLENPLFDLTVVRVVIIALLCAIAFDYQRSTDFVDVVLKQKMTWVLFPYVFVVFYTMVLRVDFNAFFNPFIDILCMYLLIYVIKDCVGVDKTLKMLIAFLYILVILGIEESITTVSPFSYLVTLDGIYTGRYIRGGHYRIMGNCIHSLGYGLLLMSAMPLAGYDIKEKTFNVYRRPLLLFGIIANVFLTGSRSSLGVVFLCYGMMFILSDRKYLKRNCLYTFAGIIVGTGIIVLLQPTGAGKYIMLQITSLVDTIFNTSFSVKYGANLEQLGQSAAYRDLLKKVFKVKWLNPVLGIGRKRAFLCEIDGLVVASIDSFYIADYIRYAYPGMISYIVYLVYMGVVMLKDMIRTRSALIRTLFIGAVSYCVHLYIADSLMTMKYLYVLFAIYICCDKTPYVAAEKSRYFKKRKSRYVKKG